MNVTPGPSTFAEALRLLSSRYLIAAGIGLGVGATVLVAIIVWGGWPASLYPTMLDLLGKALLGAIIGQTLVLIFLGLGGPVRRFKASMLNATIETEGDSDSE